MANMVRRRLNTEWLSANKMTEKFCVSIALVPGIAAANGIRVMKLPGFPHLRYNAEDVERVLAESVSVAGGEAAGKAVAG